MKTSDKRRLNPKSKRDKSDSLSKLADLPAECDYHDRAVASAKKIQSSQILAGESLNLPAKHLREQAILSRFPYGLSHTEVERLKLLEKKVTDKLTKKAAVDESLL